MKTILYTFLSIFLTFTTSCNSSRYRIIETEGHTIPMDSLQKETNDTDFIAAVDNYKAQVDSIANQVIGHSAISWIYRGRKVFYQTIHQTYYVTKSANIPKKNVILLL